MRDTSALVWLCSLYSGLAAFSNTKLIQICRWLGTLLKITSERIYTVLSRLLRLRTIKLTRSSMFGLNERACYSKGHITRTGVLSERAHYIALLEIILKSYESFATIGE